MKCNYEEIKEKLSYGDKFTGDDYDLLVSYMEDCKSEFNISDTQCIEKLDKEIDLVDIIIEYDKVGLLIITHLFLTAVRSFGKER